MNFWLADFINMYPGEVGEGFYELIEEIALQDLDMICFLLGDGQ
jgi:hypothetical protein